MDLPKFPNKLFQGNRWPPQIMYGLLLECNSTVGNTFIRKRRQLILPHLFISLYVFVLYIFSSCLLFFFSSRGMSFLRSLVGKHTWWYLRLCRGSVSVHKCLLRKLSIWELWHSHLYLWVGHYDKITLENSFKCHNCCCDIVKLLGFIVIILSDLKLV